MNLPSKFALKTQKNSQRPTRDDLLSADKVQILPIPVQGDWDFTTDRPHFELFNTDDIVHNYQKIYELFNLAICE